MTSGLAVPLPSVQRQPQELAALGIIPSQMEQFSEIVSANRTEATAFGRPGEHTRPRSFSLPTFRKRSMRTALDDRLPRKKPADTIF